jgi:molybdopterin-guanine dinucleotide biosynthesis protein A
MAAELPDEIRSTGIEPLIVHIVRALKRMFAETVIVAAPDQQLPDVPAFLVRDKGAYQGPVGGIYYGLKAASRKFCFVTSCATRCHSLSSVFCPRREAADAGTVITAEKNQLASGCAWNVNGLEFIRNLTAKIRIGDKILILSEDAGG